MTNTGEHITVGAYWRNRVFTAGGFTDACYRFLTELEKVSSLFSNRCTVAGDELLTLPRDLQSFRQILARALADPDYVYTNPDKSVRSFTLDSTLPQGFVAAFSDCNPQATEGAAVSILVRGGAHGYPQATGSAFIVLPPPDAGLAYDEARRKQLIEVMIRVWSPEYASISSKELLSVLDSNRKSWRPFGALMYFDPRIPEHLIADTPHVSVLPQQGAATMIAIDASALWVDSVDKFRPAFEKFKNAGLLSFNQP